jgi:hypothetical protein
MPAKPSPGRMRKEKWEKRMQKIGGLVLTVRARGQRRRVEMKMMKTIEYGCDIIMAVGALQGKALRKWDGHYIWATMLGFEKKQIRAFSSLGLSIIPS